MAHPHPIPNSWVWEGAKRFSIMPPRGREDEIGACDAIVEVVNGLRTFNVFWEMDGDDVDNLNKSGLLIVSFITPQLVPHSVQIPPSKWYEGLPDA